jgi:hypothetical protein
MSTVSSIRRLLYKFQLPDPEIIMKNPPNKPIWKDCETTGRNIGRKISPQRAYSGTLPYKRMLLIFLTIFGVQIHLIPTKLENQILKLDFLTGTNFLQTNRTKFNGNEIPTTCSLCTKENETVKHFILHCKQL